MSNFSSYKCIPLIHSTPKKAFAFLDIVSRDGGDVGGDQDGTKDSDLWNDQDQMSLFWWNEAYSSDEFRMYEFKVRRCVRTRTHDWTDCPFAHPGEKARRRDPHRYHYSGNICPLFRRDGRCIHGDTCDFAHGVFECWLHPSRYRTMPCKDGMRCRRKVCFFAHTSHQLRLTSSGTICRNYNKTIFPPKAASTTGGSSLCSPTSTSTGLSYTSPPPSPPVQLEEIVKSMEAMELRSGCSTVELLWPNDSGREASDDEGTVPDLEWVNELVM